MPVWTLCAPCSRGSSSPWQIVHAVRAGVFVPTKRELLAVLDDPSEHMLLAHSIDPSEAREEDYAALQQWCSAIMQSLSAI